MRKKKTRSGTAARPARATHGRQRQRLIDACISALHIYGPSRTTVEKVVAIADMSPGIVRFYFDSKAAMLVASLQYLSAEFEERVLLPVAKLTSAPVAGLERLVDLYLDPEIASARKVSVWYSFWGEASSRQEYYDICGQKDERFAALVHELVAHLIVDTGQAQLDPDGIALGLIGVLEMLWQGFAFQTETAIDRAAAKHRCMAYLRSVFPGRFPLSRGATEGGGASADPGRSLPAWSYAEARLPPIERELLFRDSWQFVGHAAGVAGEGTYLAADVGAERALVVRDAQGELRAFRNSCPAQPHALVANGAGAFAGGRLECRLHGLRFDLAGRPITGAGSLHPLRLALAAGLIFVSSDAAAQAAPSLRWREGLDGVEPMPIALPQEATIAADWKLVVEHYLDMAMPAAGAVAGAEFWSTVAVTPGEIADEIVWQGRPLTVRRPWSNARYRTLVGARADEVWRRIFAAPNQFAEIRPDGMLWLQIVPLEAGRCRLRRHVYSTIAADRRGVAAARLAARIAPCLHRDAGEWLESVQRGVVEFGYRSETPSATGRAAARFRAWLNGRVPALASVRAPGDWR